MEPAIMYGNGHYPAYSDTKLVFELSCSLLNADRYISAVVVVVASASSTSEESDYIDSFGSQCLSVFRSLGFVFI
ncbi:unnamed protein product [Prunus armeniaca]